MAEEYNYPAKPDFYIWDQSVPGETPVLKSYKNTPYYQTWLQKVRDEQTELSGLVNPVFDCDAKPTQAEKLSCCNGRATTCAQLWADLGKAIEDYLNGSCSLACLNDAKNYYAEQAEDAGCSSFGSAANSPPLPSYWCYGWDPYDWFGTYDKCKQSGHENNLKNICKKKYGNAGGGAVGGVKPVLVSIQDSGKRTTSTSLTNSNPKVVYIPTDGASRLDPGYI